MTNLKTLKTEYSILQKKIQDWEKRYETFDQNFDKAIEKMDKQRDKILASIDRTTDKLYRKFYAVEKKIDNHNES